MDLLNRGDFVKVGFAMIGGKIRFVPKLVVRNGNLFVLITDAKRLAMRDASGVAKENAIGPNAQIVIDAFVMTDLLSV